MFLSILVILLSLSLETRLCHEDIQPHIVLIIADDLGWGDVGFTDKHMNNTSSWTGPETPYLNDLASRGIVLDNLYTQAICTPTRAAIMTGKYPHRLGTLFSSSVILAEDEALSHRLITEDLYENFGYKVYGVGKWHLGFHSPDTPLDRGFVSFYGCYSGGIDHFTHETNRIRINEEDGSPSWETSPDFHDDRRSSDNVRSSVDISDEVMGKHSTDLFTDEAVRKILHHDEIDPMFLYLSYTAPHSPLVPVEEVVVSRNQHIADPAKRRYAAMVTQIDDGVGRIVAALRERNMWRNTVFMFMSDHGASVIPQGCWDTIGGSNHPFRDGKATFFEGGIKSAALVWTPWLTLRQRGTHSPALLHAVDIYTLLLTVARDNLSDNVHSSWEEEEGEAVSSDLDAGSYLVNVVRGKGVSRGRDTILHNLVAGPLPEHRTISYCIGKFPYATDYAVIRYRDFKLFHGPGIAVMCESDFLARGCDMTNMTSRHVPMMLFDLSIDPYEEHDVAELYPGVVEHMVGLIEFHRANARTSWM